VTTIAYIANRLPSPVEPYVLDEIEELRGRGVRVVCCSGRRASRDDLSHREVRFLEEAFVFYPPSPARAIEGLQCLLSNSDLMKKLLRVAPTEDKVTISQRFRFLGHTVLGAALAKTLLPFRVDHIHAHHGYFASSMAMVAAAILEAGFSFTLHGSDLLLGKGALLGTKLESCRFCVTVSEFNRHFLLNKYPHIPESKVLVAPLGVDPATVVQIGRSESRSRKLHILSVGRLHAVKNYRFLIDACDKLRKQGIDFECRIAGDGPEHRALERQVRRLRLENTVFLLGHVPRASLARYYRDADLFVLTSNSEGVPVTLMEAMSNGTIVLAPAITGIPELVIHGRTGFLYKAGSMVDFMNSARWILDRANSLSEVRRAAVQHIAEFYDRRKNLFSFTNQFLSRIHRYEESHAHSLLQQVQLQV